MKSIYKIWGFIACLALASCYEEDPITPSESGGAGRFEFPQGDNSWDDDIVEIYNEFGVRIIYADIVEQDFTKSWTGSTAGMITYHGTGTINDDMTRFYVKFLKDHVFNYVNPQITVKVFPMYWYLTFDFHNKFSLSPEYILNNPLKSHADLNLMDCWLTCFWGQSVGMFGPFDPIEAWMSPVAGNKESYTVRRTLIINDILTGAIDLGNITIPAEFDTGLDYNTPLVTGEYPEDKANPNYYLRRGFPGDINTNSAEYAKPTTYPPTPKEAFLGYVQIAFRYTQAEREVMFPSDTYPLVKEKFNYVERYMKDTYKIDLNAIAEGPEEWDITPYPELPPAIIPGM